MDETYFRILCAIPSEHKKYTIILLQLITVSEQPITIEEAVDAIAVRTDKQPYFSPKYRMPDPQEISRYCSSLVTIVAVHNSSHSGSESRVELQLAHFSVKEYLMSNRLDADIAPNFQECQAGAAVAKICLAYLLHFDEEVSPTDIMRCFPLAKYSATNWMVNAKRARDTDNETIQLTEQLLCSSKSAYKVCYSLYRPDRPWYEPYKAKDTIASALYYAAIGGLQHAIECLLNRDVDVNAQGGRYGNALQAASLGGHEQIVRLLIEKGADVNVQGGEYGNALQAASLGGHEQTVRLLMEEGADVNTQCGLYGSALQAASVEGHKQIVKLLLENNANVKTRGGRYGNALQAASAGGHEQIVEVLLGNDAEIDVHGGRYGSAMHAAAHGGHKEILESLISSSTTSSLHDYYGRTLLWWAAAGGNAAIVEALINQHNIDPQIADRFGRTPCWVATKKGYGSVSKLLYVHDRDNDIEQAALSDCSSDQQLLECDVCTLSIQSTAYHYHCNSCIGGDWDMCDDCKNCGATCLEMAHILVKRKMIEGVWVEITC